MSSPENTHRDPKIVKAEQEALNRRLADMERTLNESALELKALKNKKGKKGPEAPEVIVAAIEEKKAKVVQLIEKKEAATEARRNLVASLQESGLREDDLTVIPAWEGLSDGQKQLVTEQISQHVLLHIKELGEQRFKEKNQITTKKFNPVSFARKIYKNVTKSFWISQEEKQVLAEARQHQLKPDAKTIEALVNRTAEMNLNVISKEGKAYIEFASGESMLISPEDKEVVDHYNEVANQYAQMPDAWRNEESAKSLDGSFGKNKNYKMYEAKQAEYIQARDQLLLIKQKEYGASPNTTEKQALVNAMQFVKDLDFQVAMLQFTTTNPNALDELKKIENESSYQRLLNSQNISKAIYAGTGAVGRYLLTGTLGLVTGPFVASIIGADRAGRLAEKKVRSAFNEGRTQETALDRRAAGKEGLYEDKNSKRSLVAKLGSGFDINAKEVAAFVDADSQMLKLDTLMQKLETSTNDREKIDLRRMLLERIDYIETKQSNGLINYGREEDGAAIGQNYSLLKKVSEATVIANQELLFTNPDMGAMLDGMRAAQIAHFLDQTKKDGTPYSQEEAEAQAQQAMEIFIKQNMGAMDDEPTLLSRVMARNEAALDKNKHMYIGKEIIRGATVGAVFSLLGAKAHGWIFGHHAEAGMGAVHHDVVKHDIVKHNPILKKPIEHDTLKHDSALHQNPVVKKDLIVSSAPAIKAGMTHGDVPPPILKKEIVPPTETNPKPPIEHTQPKPVTAPEKKIITEEPKKIIKPEIQKAPVDQPVEKPKVDQALKDRQINPDQGLKDKQIKLDSNGNPIESKKYDIDESAGSAYQDETGNEPFYQVSSDGNHIVLVNGGEDGSNIVVGTIHNGDMSVDASGRIVYNKDSVISGISSSKDQVASLRDRQVPVNEGGGSPANASDTNPNGYTDNQGTQGVDSSSDNYTQNHQGPLNQGSYDSQPEIKTPTLTTSPSPAITVEQVSTPEQLLAKQPAIPIEEIDNYQAPVGIDPMRHTTGGIALGVPVNTQNIAQDEIMAHRLGSLHDMKNYSDVADRIGHDNAFIVKSHDSTINGISYENFNNRYDYKVFNEEHLTFGSYEYYEKDRILQQLFGYAKGGVVYNKALDKNVFGIQMTYFRRDIPMWTSVKKIPAKYFFDKHLMKGLPEANIKLLQKAGVLDKSGDFVKQKELQNIAKAFEKSDPLNAYPNSDDTIETYISRLTRLGLHQAKDGTFFILKKGVDMDAALQPKPEALSGVAYVDEEVSPASYPVRFTN